MISCLNWLLGISFIIVHKLHWFFAMVLKLRLEVLGLSVHVVITGVSVIQTNCNFVMFSISTYSTSCRIYVVFRITYFCSDVHNKLSFIQDSASSHRSLLDPKNVFLSSMLRHFIFWRKRCFSLYVAVLGGSASPLPIYWEGQIYHRVLDVCWTVVSHYIK